jgi:hypothetical protein
MTTLSWLIYLADVAESLNIIVTVGLALSGLAFVVWGIINLACEDHEREDLRKRLSVSSLGVVVAIMGFLVVVSPSYKTVVAIAATEAAHAVVTTPQAQDMLEAVSERLKKELEGTDD